MSGKKGSASSSKHGSPVINPHKNQFNLLPKQSMPLLPPNANSTINLNNSTTTNANASGADVQSNNSSVNNTLKHTGKLKKKKPLLQKNPSYSTSKYVYSVDDDLDEIERDMEREYLEGYNDALRYRYKKSTKNLKEAYSNPQTKEQIQFLTHEALTDLINADATLKKLEQTESDMAHKHHPTVGDDTQPQHSLESSQHSLHHPQSPGQPLQLPQQTLSQSQVLAKPRVSTPLQYSEQSKQLGYQSGQETDGYDNETANDLGNKRDPEDGNQDEEVGDVEEEEDNGDMDSISSHESFTLRNRQDAINTTHPFGIRIWKPALYKKVRSVDREADKDIHETGLVTKQITWEVHLTNFIWFLTFGILLCILCILGAAFLLVFGSVNYAKVFYNLGMYLLWPFGKVVYLQKDENYLTEDINEGSTIREYERWRDEEQNKLFFSPSHHHNHHLNHAATTSELLRPQAERSESNAILSPATSSRLAPSQSRDRNASVEQEDEDQQDRKMRFFGRGDWSLGRVLFYLYFYLILVPVFILIWLLCWLLVFTIPMAKVITTLTNHLRRHPLAIFYKFDSLISSSERVRDSNILVCTYRSSGFRYYKYTVEGTNIFFINLMFIVIFTILDFYFLKEFIEWESIVTNSNVIFALCLFSIIPLAYFIGQAVASISAQSSMGVGAVINAFFSTVVEIFLYCVALNQGKGSLVEGSLIGSILGAVLLLPGLSMCAGAFIRKTQRYNPASAGVSCTILLFSVTVMVVPTVFRQIYGKYEIRCTPCSYQESSLSIPNGSCQTCEFLQPPLQIDNFFKHVLKPFSVVCAILLFLAYTIGLWFTLRTHAALIWQTPITDSKQRNLPPTPSVENVHQALETQQAQVVESGGHDAPNWSRSKSSCVLLGATLLYAIIAEILVDCVDSVLKDFPINPKFLGITIFALVPNTTEFLNAISFATHGNVALSMEIGSAYALQVCLIQIPSLVLYSLFLINPDDTNQWSIKDSMFTLIFPNWDVLASVVSVVLFTYIYAEGKSNYFKGSILILIYIVVIIGFYFTGSIESMENLMRTSFTVITNH